MKKLILSAVAASLMATPIVAASAEAQTRRVVTVQHKANGTTVRKTVVKQTPNRVAFRKWNRGQRFDRRYAQNYRVVYNPRSYRLNAAPRGYYWVRSGNDAVLIAATTGMIASVIANAIHY